MILLYLWPIVAILAAPLIGLLLWEGLNKGD